MRTITTNVFTYDELSPEAQEAAIAEVRDAWDHAEHISEEYLATLKAAEEAFHLGRTQFEVDYGRGWAKPDFSGWYDYDDSHVGMTARGDEARAYFRENWGKLLDSKECPWTGYCCDEALLRGLREFLADEEDQSSTVKEVLVFCFDSWAQAWGDEIEYLHSDEAVAETIQANGYEFTAEGRMI